MPPSSPTKRVLASFPFSGCVLTFFAICSSNIGRIKKQIRCGRSPSGARFKKRLRMETRKLGNSDIKITRVGYGAWAIGGSGWEFAWGAQEDADSIAAIHRSLELGVNWIDTAAVYGVGHSEEVVARALKEWRGPRPYVFTKCGLRWGANGNVRKLLSPGSIRREVEDSLRRLSVDVIDLYQIHWPPDSDSSELEEGWSTLASLQRQGKVRWIGVSNFNVQQLRR